MLKVNAGVCGRVRIVKQNSITGETTADIEFNNIWTDFGINRISTYASQVADWPNRLHWGSGARAEPHNAVTSLATPVGNAVVSFSSGATDVVTSGNLCTITKTRSATQAARGVAWDLSELGVSYGSSSSSLDTYALVRDLNGDPDPLPVSDIEIITIYYTIQAQYPVSLPPQAVEVEGLPPTTATFLLRPDQSGFGGAMAATQSGAAFTQMGGFTTAEFGGRVNGSNSGTENVWGVNVMNRTTEYFGNDYAISHIWTLDPPITKDDTQELRLEIFWQFANASPVE